MPFASSLPFMAIPLWTPKTRLSQFPVSTATSLREMPIQTRFTSPHCIGTWNSRSLSIRRRSIVMPTRKFICPLGSKHARSGRIGLVRFFCGSRAATRLAFKSAMPLAAFLILKRFSIRPNFLPGSLTRRFLWHGWKMNCAAARMEKLYRRLRHPSLTSRML